MSGLKGALHHAGGHLFSCLIFLKYTREIFFLLSLSIHRILHLSTIIQKIGATSVSALSIEQGINVRNAKVIYQD